MRAERLDAELDAGESPAVAHAPVDDDPAPAVLGQVDGDDVAQQRAAQAAVPPPMTSTRLRPGVWLSSLIRELSSKHLTVSAVPSKSVTPP